MDTHEHLTEEQNKKLDSLSPQGRRTILTLSLLADEKKTKRMARRLAEKIQGVGPVGAREFLDVIRKWEREMRRENDVDWWKEGRYD